MLFWQIQLKLLSEAGSRPSFQPAKLFKSVVIAFLACASMSDPAKFAPNSNFHVRINLINFFCRPLICKGSK